MATPLFKVFETMGFCIQYICRNEALMISSYVWRVLKIIFFSEKFVDETATG
jgi:hypothetical protein